MAHSPTVGLEVSFATRQLCRLGGTRCVPTEMAMLIERYLPTFDVRDYHEVQLAVPADRAYVVLRSLDLTRS